MKKSFRDLLCLGFIGVLYQFAVLKSVLIPMHVPVKGWQMLLFALAAILFLFLADTRPGRIVLISAVGLGVGYIAYQLIAKGSKELAENLEPVLEFGKTVVTIGSGYYDEKITQTMLMLTVGLFALILAVPIYYLLVPKLRFYWLIVPGIGLFVALWTMFRHVDRLSFYMFMVVAIVCFIQYKVLIYRRTSSERREIPAGTNAIVFFIPVAVVILLIASAFTIRNVPVQWKWLDEKINFWYWQLHVKYNVDRYDRFSLEKTGFGDPARLGGPIYPDYTPIMVVKAPARVYLRGAVYDEYTGAGWNKSEQEEPAETSDRAMDLLELRYGWKASSISQGIYNLKAYREFLEEPTPEDSSGISTSFGVPLDALLYINRNGIDVYMGEVNTPGKEDPMEYLNFLRLQQVPQLLSRLHPEQTLNVRHLQVRTQSLFTPLKTYVPINGLPGYTLTESPEGTFDADVRLQKDSEYEFNYIQPAYGMDILERYFSYSYPGLYIHFIEANENFINELDQFELTNEESIKQEIENLLKIYKDLQNYSNDIYNRYVRLPETIPVRVYDKAMNATYGKKSTFSKVEALVSSLKEDFTYTLTPGLPPENEDFVDYFLFEGKEGYCSYFASALCVLARTVQIPARYVEGFVMPETPDENGYYHVTNQYAHAWVEVYIEGVGWVTVDPTPPYAGAMNYLVSLDESEGAGYYEELPPQIPDQYLYMPNDLPLNVDFEYNQKAPMKPVVVLIWAGAFILAVMLLNLLAVLLRRLILRLIPARKSVPALYRYLVMLLKQTGCVIKPGETPKDFAKRVDERFQLIHMTMADMVEHFYSVRFGAHVPDKKTFSKLIVFSRELKAKSGRALYLHKRLLLRGLLFRG